MRSKNNFYWQKFSRVNTEMQRILLKNITFSILLLSVFFVGKYQAIAQNTSTINSEATSIELSVSPENPRPNENISLEISSFSTNLDGAKIYWYIDDVLRKEGVGETTLNTQTKGSGKVTKVKVVINTTDGANIEKSVSINPAQVDLIVEPTSYTPPFYKGKGYFVNQGKVKIIAIPDIVKDGVKLNSRNLNFKWTKDGIVLGDYSGVGKDTLVVNGSVPIKDISIDVEILDSSRNVLADGFTMISPSDPKIIFYEDSPLYGEMFNRAIARNYFLGNKEELRVVAEPYFFDIAGINSNDSNFKWSVNGQSVTLDGSKNTLLLRQENSGVKGIASVSLQVENLARIFQYAGNGFSVEFGQ